MRYQPTLSASYETVGAIAASVQRGQWIDLDGAQGRVAGVRNGTVWIMWSGTAGRKAAAFPTFVKAFKRGAHQ